MASFEPAKVLEYKEGDDPKLIVWNALGKALDNLTLYLNDVLLVTAPTLTVSKGGIIYVDNTKNEERFQGKIGLVVALGEVAFNNEKFWPNVDTRPTVGDWVVYRNADTHECSISKLSCRFIKDNLIIGKVSTPDAIR